MASTYVASRLGAFLTTSKFILDVFNPAASGKIVKVYRIWAQNSQTAAITGVPLQFTIFRTTAASAGTSIVPVTFDSTNTALGTVSAGTGRTVTAAAGDALRRVWWSSDEASVNGGTVDEWQNYTSYNYWWNSTFNDANVEPIVCQAGQGVAIQQITTSVVGSIDIFMEFTVQ